MSPPTIQLKRLAKTAYEKRVNRCHYFHGFKTVPQDEMGVLRTKEKNQFDLVELAPNKNEYIRYNGTNKVGSNFELIISICCLYPNAQKPKEEHRMRLANVQFNYEDKERNWRYSYEHEELLDYQRRRYTMDHESTNVYKIGCVSVDISIPFAFTRIVLNGMIKRQKIESKIEGKLKGASKTPQNRKAYLSEPELIATKINISTHPTCDKFDFTFGFNPKYYGKNLINSCSSLPEAEQLLQAVLQDRIEQPKMYRLDIELYETTTSGKSTTDKMKHRQATMSSSNERKNTNGATSSHREFLWGSKSRLVMDGSWYNLDPNHVLNQTRSSNIYRTTTSRSGGGSMSAVLDWTAYAGTAHLCPTEELLVWTELGGLVHVIRPLGYPNFLFGWAHCAFDYCSFFYESKCRLPDDPIETNFSKLVSFSKIPAGTKMIIRVFKRKFLELEFPESTQAATAAAALQTREQRISQHHSGYFSILQNGVRAWSTLRETKPFELIRRAQCRLMVMLIHDKNLTYRLTSEALLGGKGDSLVQLSSMTSKQFKLFADDDDDHARSSSAPTSICKAVKVPRGAVVSCFAYQLWLKSAPQIGHSIRRLDNCRKVLSTRSYYVNPMDDRHLNLFEHQQALRLECQKTSEFLKTFALPEVVKRQLYHQLCKIFDQSQLVDDHNNNSDNKQQQQQQHQEQQVTTTITNDDSKKASKKAADKRPKQVAFAVRSSAVGEDATETSAAGQMRSFLDIRGFENVCRSIVACWASQFELEAVTYKTQHLLLFNWPMAVIVQELIDCDVAGVAATCNPIDGRPNQLEISANYGLGEGVVAGDRTDTIRVKLDMEQLKWNQETRSFEGLLSRQPELVAANVEKLADVESDECCLSDDIIVGLSNLLIWLRNQDEIKERCIEWGITFANSDGKNAKKWRRWRRAMRNRKRAALSSLLAAGNKRKTPLRELAATTFEESIYSEPGDDDVSRLMINSFWSHVGRSVSRVDLQTEGPSDEDEDRDGYADYDQDFGDDFGECDYGPGNELNCFGHDSMAAFEIYLLQSRPLTNLNKPSRQVIAHELDSGIPCADDIITRANMGEVMSGCISPLMTSHFMATTACTAVEKPYEKFHSIETFNTSIHNMCAQIITLSLTYAEACNRMSGVSEEFENCVEIMVGFEKNEDYNAEIIKSFRRARYNPLFKEKRGLFKLLAFDLGYVDGLNKYVQYTLEHDSFLDKLPTVNELISMHLQDIDRKASFETSKRTTDEDDEEEDAAQRRESAGTGSGKKRGSNGADGKTKIVVTQPVEEQEAHDEAILKSNFETINRNRLRKYSGSSTNLSVTNLTTTGDEHGEDTTGSGSNKDAKKQQAGEPVALEKLVLQSNFSPAGKLDPAANLELLPESRDGLAKEVRRYVLHLFKRLTSETGYCERGWHNHVRATILSMSYNTICLYLLTRQEFYKTVVDEKERKNIILNDFSVLIRDYNKEKTISGDMSKQLDKIISHLAKEGRAQDSHQMSCKELFENLCDLSNQHTSAKKFRHFLNKFGHRAFKEFDYANPTWNEDPTHVVKSLKLRLKLQQADCTSKTLNQYIVESHGQRQHQDQHQRQQQEMERTELSIVGARSTNLYGTMYKIDPNNDNDREARYELVLSRVTGHRAPLINFAIPRAQKAAARRERTKSSLIKTIDMYRKGFRALGAMLCLEGRLNDVHLINYLALDELNEIVNAPDEGRADLARLIFKARRRLQVFRSIETSALPKPTATAAKECKMIEDIIDGKDIVSAVDQQSLPETIKGRAAALYSQHSVQEEHEMTTPTNDAAAMPMSQQENCNALGGDNKSSVIIHGMTSCNGVVTGRACVIDTIDEMDLIQPNDILITYSIDVSWTVYFFTISGIVTEVGGIVSHGAVVAREYGIPTLCKAVGACTKFKTGQIVTLDAVKGICYLVSGSELNCS